MELTKDVIDICVYGLDSIVGGAIVATYSWKHNAYTNRVINVKYFQSGFYMKRRYMEEIGREIKQLLDNHHANPKNTSRLRFSGTRLEDSQAIEAMFSMFKTTITNIDIPDNLVKQYAKTIFDTYLYTINVPLSVRGTGKLVEWVSKLYNEPNIDFPPL